MLHSFAHDRTGGLGTLSSNVQEDRASWHIDLRVLVKLLCEGAALIKEVVHCLLVVILRRMLEGTFHSRQMIQSRLHPRLRKLLPKQRRGRDSQRTEGAQYRHQVSKM